MDSLPREFVVHSPALVGVYGLHESQNGTRGTTGGTRTGGGGGQSTAEGVAAAAGGAVAVGLAIVNNVINDSDSDSNSDSSKPPAVQAAAAQQGKSLVAIFSHSFPPRKPPAFKVTAQPSSSPLSPSCPTSPLFPDGIMIPAWVAKHRDTTPAVVAMFVDLWESIENSNRKDPLGAQQVSNLERDRDQILAAEINEKRKNVQEAGLKFVAVIIVKTYRADDPVIEERLSYIRRSAMLDRHHQFTVSVLAENGVSPDIEPFVDSLQKSLHDIAAAYYREHEKRIKRKKAKLLAQPKQTPPAFQTISGSTSIASLPGSSPNSQRQLSTQAWNVRYDYKLGIFAEFRHDIDVALRHYDSAYNTLISIMQQSLAAAGASLAPGGGGTATGPSSYQEIQPSTPRWTEARIFIDSLSIKMFRLLVFTGHPTNALAQLHKHFVCCREFPEFSFTTASFDGTSRDPSQVSGLGHLALAIGGGSFEYWAWASMNYRAFGEIIEMASTKRNMQLPYPPPGATANTSLSLNNIVANPGLSLISSDGMAAALFSPFSSVNPLFTVQHAGYYYLLAARCAEERWNKFKKASASSILRPLHSAKDARSHSRSFSQDSMGSINRALEANSAMVAEQSVDHPLLIIELLTKSYEQFKKTKSSRTTIFLASDIARMYTEGGKFDMAFKFFDRISKTYRKECWFTILASINRWMMKCAHQLGLPKTAFECLVELLCEKLTPLCADRVQVLSDLLAMLDGRTIPSPQAGSRLDVQLDMDTLTSFLEYLSAQIDLGTFAPGETKTFEMFIRAFVKPGSRTIQETLYAFLLSSPLDIQKQADGRFDLSDTRLLSKEADKVAGLPPVINFVYPFETIVDVNTLASPVLACRTEAGILSETIGSEASDLHRSYRWTLRAYVRMVGKWGVEVERLTASTQDLNNPSSVLVAIKEIQQPPADHLWRHGDARTFLFELVTKVDVFSVNSKVDIGALLIKWRRTEPSHGDWVHTVVELPKVEIPAGILHIHAATLSFWHLPRCRFVPIWNRELAAYKDIPGDVVVGKPFLVTYTIQNTTLHLAELVSYIESSEHFVFAGYKQSHIRVLPLGTHTLTLQLVAINSGRCALPNLKVLKRTDAAMLMSSATKDGEGARPSVIDPAMIKDKVFTVHAEKLHSVGSRNGELYVFVQPRVIVQR
eukprot:jgi/Hompol1/2786/HPOL_000378-RA